MKNLNSKFRLSMAKLLGSLVLLAGSLANTQPASTLAAAAPAQAPLIYRCTLSQDDGAGTYVINMGHLVLPGLKLTEWTELDLVNVDLPDYQYHLTMMAGPFSKGENLMVASLRFGKTYQAVGTAQAKVGVPKFSATATVTTEGVKSVGSLECILQ